MSNDEGECRSLHTREAYPPHLRTLETVKGLHEGRQIDREPKLNSKI